MELDGRLLRVSFSGTCGTRLTQFFYDGINTLGRQFDGQVWGYLSHSTGFEAATPDAEDKITQAYKLAIKLGCRYDAYVISTALGRAQTQSIMRKAGSPMHIDEVLFDQASDAEHYLLSSLAKHQEA